MPGEDQLREDTRDEEKKYVGVFLNSRYQVSVYNYDSPWGRLDWLAIVNLDRSARHDWRDFQRIKNELLGEDREAFEMYPSEERLVDTNNQYHLFVLPPGKAFPIGFAARDVSDQIPEGTVHKQRSFESPPEDLNTSEYHGKVWPIFGPADDGEPSDS